MPIYTYHCSNCEKEFEEFKKISESDSEEICDCGTKATKILGESTFILKGGGWFADNYSKVKKHNGSE